MPEQNPTHKIDIIVSRKEGVPSPEVDALTKQLHNSGFDSAKVLGISKLIQIDMEAPTARDAITSMEDASRQFLANPVIEEYTVFENTDRDTHTM